MLASAYSAPADTVSAAVVGGQRPNVIGNTTLDADRARGKRVARFFDTSVFAFATDWRIRKQWAKQPDRSRFSQTELAVIKSFGLPNEAGQVEFRAEIFGSALTIRMPCRRPQRLAKY